MNTTSISAFKTLSAGRFAERTGFTAVDIGARGEVDAAMLPLAWATGMIGFEPEPAAAAALESVDPAPWKSRRIVRAAVGGSDGPQTLYIPPSPESASLLKHNAEMIDWFGIDSQHSIEKTIEVDTRTLDSLAREGALPSADYIKIDVEGAEGAIIAGGADYLKDCLALQVEVAFLEQRLGQPLAWDIGRTLDEQGFMIVDIIAMQRWRHDYAPTHPYRSRAPIGYSRGLLAQADLICIRDFRHVTAAEQAAKLILIVAALGFIDFAATILRFHSDLLAGLSADYAMDLPADFEKLSAQAGKNAPRAAIGRGLRDLVPLGRSVLGGLPGR